MHYVNSAQLVHLVEREIVRTGVRPENLVVGERYLAPHNPRWELDAEYDAGGEHHTVRLVIDPPSGRVSLA